METRTGVEDGAMSMRQTLRQAGREWLVGLTAYALLVAPFGCQFQSGLLGDGLDAQSAGLFLNTDTSDPLIVAGRNAAGDAFFVYGTRQSNGDVGEVDSILLKTAAGESALIAFELGRPVYLQGPDGSYVRITYDEVSTERLAASAEIYDAQSKTSETVSADVDLRATAQQVAVAVQEITGQPLHVPTLSLFESAKSQNRALNPLLQISVVLPMVLVTQALIVSMGQVMNAVFQAVSTAFQAVVIVAFWPVFAFAALLGEVSSRVESVPLINIFVELPAPPVIDIVIN